VVAVNNPPRIFGGIESESVVSLNGFSTENHCGVNVSEEYHHPVNTLKKIMRVTINLVVPNKK
jgi:hypothetical protein